MWQHRIARHAGFTVLELLIVIAIIGILLGIVIPAVQGVRVAAERTNCQNNLRQLAMACHMYHDVHKFLPSNGQWQYYGPRTWAGSVPADAPDQKWSVCYQILPYLEKNDLYLVADDETIKISIVPIFHCLMRREPVTLSSPTFPNGGVRIDYGANLGSNDTDTDGRKFCGPIVHLFDKEGIATNKKVKLTDITDGQSNTLFWGEKWVRMDKYTAAYPDWQWGDTHSWTVGGTYITTRLGKQAPLEDKDLTVDTRNGGVNRWGSAHPGGFNVVMADGSARMIGYGIDLNLLKNLCDINDGNPVDLSQLN